MKIIRTYFTLVTLITVAIFLIGAQLAPDASLSYTAFAIPLIYAACGVLPSVVMYSRKELTVKQFLVRKVIQLGLIEILLFTVIFDNVNELKERTDMVILVTISVFIIYTLVHILDWFQKSLSAKKMTEELMCLQQAVK
ncbi:MAG: hypothetical protein IJN92_07265 [Lachnospiraceae bacterium]|nr:hypothetical protein [Lachnospiraceae bacterium]